MRILLLTNLLPWPLDNGGKIKTYTVLQGLKKGGHVTDLVCFSERSEPDPESEAEILKLCDNVKQIHMKLTTAENKAYMTGMAVRSLVSRYSFGVYKYKSGAMKEVLGALAVRYRYDLVYYDQHVPGNWLKYFMGRSGEKRCQYSLFWESVHFTDWE